MSVEASNVKSEGASTPEVVSAPGTGAPASESSSQGQKAPEGIQGLKVISEDDLRGTPSDPVASVVVAPAAGANSQEKGSAESVAPGSTPASPEPSAAGTAKPAESSKEKEGEVIKPPKGFVPLSAITEARGENRYLKEQNKALEARLVALEAGEKSGEKPAGIKSNVPEGFKVLSPEEFKALAKDDPTEGLLYMQNLVAYQADQVNSKVDTKLNAKDSESFQREYAQIVETTVAQMEEAVPGIFDKNSTAAADLATFAESIGFDKDMYYLTNPETKIILPGDSEPLLLGEQAASILRVLASAKAGMSKEIAVSEAQKAAILKEHGDALRTRIEAEVLAKIKSDPNNFRSLTSVPAAAGDTKFGSTILTTAELSKLTAEEQEAYLSGA